MTQHSVNIHAAPTMEGTVEPQEVVRRLIGMRLIGLSVPEVTLNNTKGDAIFLGADASFVIYLYPGSETADPHGNDTTLADAEQHRGFRDLHDDLVARGFATVGVSSQSVEKQREAITVNRLPQQLASDESLWLADMLTLPTFDLGGARFYDRLTLVIDHGIFVQVHFPVAVPGRNAAEVAAWLRSR